MCITTTVGIGSVLFHAPAYLLTKKVASNRNVEDSTSDLGCKYIALWPEILWANPLLGKQMSGYIPT